MLFSRVLPTLLAGVLALSSVADATTRGISIVAKDPATGKAGEVRLYRKTFAVIVGIDKYPNLPPDKQLKNAVNDARGVEGVLRRNYRFDEIVTFFDEQATKENVMRLLTAELPAKMTEEDALFLFWAGHGNQEKSAFGEIGYLLPYDGAADALYKNITMAELKETVSKKLPAKHAFYVMDACYSGLMTDKRSLGDEQPRRDLGYLREITKENVRQVLTAGSKGQEALDGGPKGHSVFTGRLIEVLEAKGDFITASEILTIIKEKVYLDAKARDHVQTPDGGRLYGSGDFVFVPNLEQKVADVAAEVAKAEAELAAIRAREEAAEKAKNEAERRAAEQARISAEAKLRAEQLRQEQLAAEARRQEEQRKEQERLAAEARRQEEALAAQRSEEAKRLAQLKAEIEKGRAKAPAVTATLELAVAEIRRLAQEINGIESAFKKEQQEGEQRIKNRYAALLAEVRAQEQVAKSKPLVQDEFETDAEFAVRERNAGSIYPERRKELERQQQAEIDELRRKSGEGAAEQTAPLRRELAVLSEKEFTLDATLLAFEVGRYDIDKQSFPFTLGNKSVSDKDTAPPLVRVAMNGTIRMSRDDAKEWKQHLQIGLVRPKVTAKPGGEVVQVAFADDASDELLLTLEDGEFVSVREKREREREREREKARMEELNREYPPDTPSKVCAQCHEREVKQLAASPAQHREIDCVSCHAGKHRNIRECHECHGLPHPKAMHEMIPKCASCHNIAHNLNNFQK